MSESRAGQNETSGGSSETAANELTISPSGVPSTSVVTNATPVAKRPNARAGARRRLGAGGMAWAAIASVQDGLAAERDVAEQVVGAVGAERVHEAAGADVAVRARERVAVEVAGAAGQRERAVDDPRRGLVDERLRRLRLGEQRDERPSSDSSTSVAARASVARQAPSSIAFSATSVRARASGSPRTRARAAAAAALSAMPSDAEAWNSPATRLRSMYALGVAGEEAAAQRRARHLDAGEGDGVAARRAHAERVPVAVDLDARRRRAGSRA